MRIQVKDFMSAPVTTASGEATVREIRALMNKEGINAIPIVSYSKEPAGETIIRGIVTASDIGKDVHEAAPMENVMTASNVLVVHVDASPQAAAKMMLRNKVHHMVVMDEGKIKGMISSLDFVKLVAEHTLE
jgi:CBS domain-containing protein